MSPSLDGAGSDENSTCSLAGDQAHGGGEGAIKAAVTGGEGSLLRWSTWAVTSRTVFPILSGCPLVWHQPAKILSHLMLLILLQMMDSKGRRPVSLSYPRQHVPRFVFRSPAQMPPHQEAFSEKTKGVSGANSMSAGRVFQTEG